VIPAFEKKFNAEEVEQKIKKNLRKEESMAALTKKYDVFVINYFDTKEGTEALSVSFQLFFYCNIYLYESRKPKLVL
jgi:hypothetical protein